MTDIGGENTQDVTTKVLKVIVVGEMGTGKTSWIRQYVQGFFSEFYKTTIGVDFANKNITWNDGVQINLQLWDIAGQERYGNMTHVYYQEAVGALVIFDVNRTKSFDMVKEWKADIDSKVLTSTGEPIPSLLLGNKIDIASEGKWNGQENIENYVKEHNFIGFFETSAREKTNIDKAAQFLVDYIMNNHIEPATTNKENAVDLTNPSNQKGGGCC